MKQGMEEHDVLGNVLTLPTGFGCLASNLACDTQHPKTGSQKWWVFPKWHINGHKCYVCDSDGIVYWRRNKKRKLLLIFVLKKVQNSKQPFICPPARLLACCCHIQSRGNHERRSELNKKEPTAKSTFSDKILIELGVLMHY
ncbi:hypothetical protein GQX74_008654 [Glossina fuscipes]|nr:hypothetical protein GQX74_008654 [Glossina fuscipes]